MSERSGSDGLHATGQCHFALRMKQYRQANSRFSKRVELESIPKQLDVQKTSIHFAIKLCTANPLIRRYDDTP